ncbi:MAG: alpha/beta fold hydrolase [Gemmataceae bacterium]
MKTCSPTPGRRRRRRRCSRPTPDSIPTLGQIRVPTLIVVGKEDALTPPSVAEAMQTRIAGAELAVVDAAGHLSNLEQPAAFTAAVAAFVQKTR